MEGKRSLEIKFTETNPSICYRPIKPSQLSQRRCVMTDKGKNVMHFILSLQYVDREVTATKKFPALWAGEEDVLPGQKGRIESYRILDSSGVLVEINFGHALIPAKLEECDEEKDGMMWVASGLKIEPRTTLPF
jgi:hypothetical protein